MRTPAVLIAVLVLVAPGGAAAASTCSTFISQDYPLEPPDTFNVPGDVIRVGLTFGAGPIIGGTQVTIHKLRFNLDCDVDDPLGVDCTDEGAIIGYEGDGTITTDCDSVFTTDPLHTTSANPNQLELVPDPPLTIPANTAELCGVEFDVRVLARSVDSTPDRIEQVGGFDANQTDAVCDNGLASAGSLSSAILVCPDCEDGDPCTSDSCDQVTGTCTYVTVCPTTTTTTSTTSTTLMGCSPSDPSAMKCETAIAEVAAQLLKRLVNCLVADARALEGSDPPVELAADGGACQAKASARFDAAIAKIQQKVTCPPDVVANVPSVRDSTLAQTRELRDLIFVCPAP